MGPNLPSRTDFEGVQELSRNTTDYEEFNRRELPKVYRAALEIFWLTPEFRNELNSLLQACQKQVHSSFYASLGSLTSPPALTMTGTSTQMTQLPLFSATPQTYPQASDTPTQIAQLSPSSATSQAYHQASDLELPAPEIFPAIMPKPVDRETFEQVGTLVRLLEENLGFQQEGPSMVEPIDTFFSETADLDWIGDSTGHMTNEEMDAIITGMLEDTDWSYDDLNRSFQNSELNDYNMPTLLAESAAQENISTENSQAEDPPP
jgi:hypothetical protein